MLSSRAGGIRECFPQVLPHPGPRPRPNKKWRIQPHCLGEIRKDAAIQGFRSKKWPHVCIVIYNESGFPGTRPHGSSANNWTRVQNMLRTTAGATRLGTLFPLLALTNLPGDTTLFGKRTRTLKHRNLQPSSPKPCPIESRVLDWRTIGAARTSVSLNQAFSSHACLSRECLNRSARIGASALACGGGASAKLHSMPVLVRGSDFERIALRTTPHQTSCYVRIGFNTAEPPAI